jgi:hypothetical protein
MSQSFESNEDDLDPRFPAEGAVIAFDEKSGDVVVYAGGAAASFSRDAWWPGVWFNKSSMLEFTSVRDPREIREYLRAANAALAKSLED